MQTQTQTMLDELEVLVESIVVVDEDSVWDAHVDNILFGDEDVERICKSLAIEKSYDALAHAINGRLGTSFGYEWGRLRAERRAPNLYATRAHVICYPDGFTDATEFRDYALAMFARHFDHDESIIYYALES